MKKITTLIVLVTILIYNSYAQQRPTASQANATSISTDMNSIVTQQQQTANETNFTSFTKDPVVITNELNAETSNEFKTNPEYGVLPFNAPCKDCYEVLQKRDEKHRYFQKTGSYGKVFYDQSSYSNLNYKDDRGVLRTIDYRLKQTVVSDVFTASNQPFPVSVNLRDKYISILNAGKELQMNRHVSLFIQNADGSLSSLGEPLWSDYTAGDNGVIVHNIYPGIDLEMQLGEGKVETFYTINKPLQLNGGSLVIRDNVQLPAGFVYDYSYSEKVQGQENHYQGALCINNEAGTRYFIIGNPAAYDENGSETDHIIGLQYATGLDGSYDLYIPISWMNDPNRSYPLIIDPFVTATSTLPEATITGSGYNATCFATGCTYDLPVTIPAACTVTNVTTTFWFQALGTCNLNQGAWDLTTGTCRFPTTGTWNTCQIGLPGLCELSNITCFSNFEPCIPAPQCASYTIPFTLTFYRCVSPGSGCGFSCITANTPWSMTVTGYTADVNTASSSVCQGSSINLTATPDSGASAFTYTYSWSPGGLTGSTVSVSPVTNTTYTVTQVACGVDTSTAISIINVIPNDNPGFTISPNPDCSGAPIQITGNGSEPKTNYSWTTPGGSPSSQNDTNSFTVSYATPGTYSVTLIYGGGGECIFDSTLQVTVANLTATAGPDTSVCGGSTVQLNATGGTTYSWLPITGLSAANISNPVATVTQTTTYTVTATTGSCSATATVTVTLRGGITVVITPGGKTTFCQGGSVNLVASGGATYLWSTTSTSSSITVNTSNTYSVVGTSSSGCTGSASQVVTVNPNPTVTITPGGNTTFCQGGSVQLTASGGATYVWSNQSTANPITVSSAGTYSVVGTNSLGCTGTASQAVIVNPNPTVGITAGGPTTFCQGGSVNLTATGASTYTWSNSTTANPISVNSSNTYSVVGTNSAGCTGTASQAVVVNPNPTITITPNGNTTFCSGDSVQLTASGASTYAWSTGTSTNPITALSAGTYSVVGTSSGGCTGTASQGVVVNPNPTVSIIPQGPTAICEGGSVQLCASNGTTFSWNDGDNTPCITAMNPGPYTVTITDANGCTGTSPVLNVTVALPPALVANVSGMITCLTPTANLTANNCTGSGITYNWSGPGGFSSALQCVTVTTGGTYTVTATDICSITTTVIVESDTTPPNVTTANEELSCVLSSVQLTASSTTAGVTFGWTGPNGFTSAMQDPTVSDSGTYIVTATDPSNGCTATASAYVNKVPSAVTGTCGDEGPVHPGIYFELNGSPNSTPPNPPDNWDLIYNGTSQADYVTGIINDWPSDADNYFYQGTKDIQDITGWNWRTNNVPDKDDLLHAGVAIYGHLLYFFADRYAVNGNSQMGFWLLKNNVLPQSNGTFSGTHSVGDLLILSDFENGGPEAVIFAYEWVGSGGSAGSLNALTLEDVNAYAVVNSAPVSTPWPYTPKFGPDNIYPPGAFFEGGIDLACWAESGIDQCFPSFIAETRSSQEPTAELKDFIYGSLMPNPNPNGPHRLAQPAADNSANNLPRAYPNPFKSTTIIEFGNASQSTHTLVEVYSLTGEKVATLFDANTDAGVSYKAEFDGSALSAGVYIYRITTGDKVTNGKLVLIK